MYFFTADEHYYHGGKSGHDGIIKYCNRPFEDIEEMHEAQIGNSNSVVKKGDTVIHAGDFTMLRNRKKIQQYLIDRLNGHHVFLKGSHDYWLPKNRSLQRWEGMIEGHYIVVDHYNMRTWARSHYNSWQLYGHCLDKETEILTKVGWKFREELSLTDHVLTLNIESGLLEYNPIDNIIDYPNYTGKMYTLKSKGIDIRVTENHIIVDVQRGTRNNRIRKLYAKDINNLERRLFIKAGILETKSPELSDKYIKLLVWIAADGSLANSDLIRIRVSKPRKIERIECVLDDLSIRYTKNKQKDGSICYNFTTPDTIRQYRLKPLTDSILSFSRKQMECLLSEYTHTDGCKNGESTIIYTSKKEEADIIQAASITKGYTCNSSERVGRGFSKKPNHELVVTNRTSRMHTNLKQRVLIENVVNEHVWCVQTKNSTIMIRRHGKPIIVGNSHGRLEPIGKQWDIGVDNNNFFPVSFEQIKEIMKGRPDNPNLIKPEDRRYGTRRK